MDDTPISGLVDKVLTEVGHLESRAAKMDIDDLLKCVKSHADCACNPMCSFPL
jgi:18S rRNA (adenine1779-N6/adenine1780-N6)-dimethyltransferase